VNPAVPTATPSPSPRPSPDAKAKSPVPDEWAEASRIFDQLTPDQKKKFLDNLDQWKAMSPEEQELFRDRELFRREKIAAEIQDAVTKSGLHLDNDQHEVFTLRYTQERRKIEEALHKEMDRKRQIMVNDMLSRLRLEFASTPAPIVVPPDNPQLH
jgi:predicted glutamine amidotransferase